MAVDSRPLRPSKPQQPVGPGSAVRESPAATELTLLLELERELAACMSPTELRDRLAAAAERVVPWQAFTLIGAGGSAPAEALPGGRGLAAGVRHRFESAVKAAARAGSLPWSGLTWSGGDFQTDAAEAGDAEILILPWAARGGDSGLLALMPVAAGPIPAPAQRLMAGLLRQAEAWLSRWRRGEETRAAERSAMLAALPGGALVVEGDDVVLAANAAAQAQLATLQGQAQREGSGLAAAGLSLRGLPAGVDIEFSGRHDQRRYALRWSPLPGAGGLRLVLLADVTLERATREHALQAEKLSVLGEMLSGVAHELNNPLATVIGFSQLVLRQSDDPEQRRRLGLVADEAQRARRIVGNLLDVARPRPAERAPVSLDEVVQGILNLFAYAFRVSNIEVEWWPGPDLPPVLGDRARLQQVLVNLVGNAQQALSTVAGPRRISLAADAVAGRVRLEVADTGPGIPEAHIDRIFMPFFTTKEPGVGTGLGLAICARIVEEHGGAIHVQSRPGEGARFIVDLPAGAARVTAPAAAPAVSESALAGGRRILVVEDEEPFRELLVQALQAEGYSAAGAADGAEALQRLEHEPWDAVVSDVRMPRMDGMALHTEVRRRRPELAGRFVFMTGDVMDPRVRAFLERQEAPHLPKPFGLDELTEALQRALAQAGDGAVLDSARDS